MISLKIASVILALVLVQVSSQYNKHKFTEENHFEKVSHPNFGQIRGLDGIYPSEQFSEGSFGFAQPQGLMAFFHTGPLYSNGMSKFIPQQEFPISIHNSSQKVNAFNGNQKTSNDKKNNVKSQSMFDSSSSTSESGFGSEYFPPGLESGKPLHLGSFSSGFAPLKKDTDRGIRYKANPDNRQKSAGRKESSEGGKSEDPENFDFSGFYYSESHELESDEKMPKDHRSNYEREERTDNLNHEQVPSSKYNYNPLETRPQENTPSKQLLGPQGNNFNTRKKLTDEYYNRKGPLPKALPTRSQYDNSHEYYSAGRVSQKPALNYPTLYYRPIVHSSAATLNGQSRGYHPVGHSYPLMSSPYEGPLPSHEERTRGSRKLRQQYRGPTLFRPVIKNTYHNPYQDFSNTKHPSSPASALSGPIQSYSFHQTEPTSVAPQKLIPPVVSIHKQKKFTKKNYKRVDVEEFPRFERQKMICYTCTNNVTNTTYEECIPETETDYRSFAKNNAETQFSKITFPSSKYHTLFRRSIGDSNKKTEGDPIKYEWPWNKRMWEYDSDDSDERKTNTDSFRYYIDHSPSDEKAIDIEDSRKIYRSQNNGYSDSMKEESQETSYIGKKDQPPQTSNKDNCRTYAKKGMICVECKNPETGGSSERCS